MTIASHNSIRQRQERDSKLEIPLFKHPAQLLKMNRSTGTSPNRLKFIDINTITFWTTFVVIALLSLVPFRVTWLMYRDCWPACELLILLFVPMCSFYVANVFAYLCMEPVWDRPYDFSLWQYTKHIVHFSTAMMYPIFAVSTMTWLWMDHRTWTSIMLYLCHEQRAKYFLIGAQAIVYFCTKI